MKDRKNGSSEIMSMILMGVLFLAMLVIVVFAASAYRSSVQAQKKNNDMRAVLSYVSTAIKANDTDDIKLEMIDGVNTLVITDHISGLEQRIYFRDGQLLENYGAVGYEFYKDGETVLGQTDLFEMSLVEDGLLKIETSFGDSYIYFKK